LFFFGYGILGQQILLLAFNRQHWTGRIPDQMEETSTFFSIMG
jgi:hypothetical protein